MECHLSAQIKEQFNTTNLYEILGVPSTVDVVGINQAYRKLALKYHPDRANGDAKKFQALSAVHSILSDPSKRKIYDDVGSLDSDDMSDDFDTWYQYFRNLFPTITVADIDNFVTKYRGSEEEKVDILELYERFDGDLFLMHNYIMCSDDDEAEQRICDLIDEAVKQQEVPLKSTYKKMKATFISNNAKRVAKRKKTTSSSSSSSSKANAKGDDLADLAAQITRQQAGRSAGMATLFAKYGGGDIDGEEEDISEEAFQAARKKLASNKDKGKVKKSTGSKK